MLMLVIATRDREERRLSFRIEQSDRSAEQGHPEVAAPNLENDNAAMMNRGVFISASSDRL